MHVKGFTARHDRVPREQRGTYAGLASPPALNAGGTLAPFITVIDSTRLNTFATYSGAGVNGFVTQVTPTSTINDARGNTVELRQGVDA